MNTPEPRQEQHDEVIRVAKAEAWDECCIWLSQNVNSLLIQAMDENPYWHGDTQ